MLKALCFLFLILPVAITACQNNSGVQTYNVEKEPTISPQQKSPHGQFSENQFSEQSPHGSGGTQGGLHWKTPTGWTEKPSSSSMRLASFVAPSKTGGAAGDVSIIVLSGQAGGLVANVNRWRGQMGLSPLGAAEVEASAKKEKNAIGPFTWFSIINEANTQSGMLVASIPDASQVIFIKMLGPKDTLMDNQGQFLALCQSLSKK